MTIDQAFNASVAYYDEWMKKALLGYEDLFLTAQQLLSFEVDRAIDVLDLGAGTGLFSQHVLAKYPQAKFVLYDVAEQMFSVAQERFRQYEQQFTYILDDYRNLDMPDRFDAVISSLSLHHLTDEEKQRLFGQIYRALRSQGIFINIDQVKGETPALQKLYWTHWLNHVKHSDASEEQIRESIARRTTYDQDALLVDQLRWLRESGFTDVDCVYKNYFIGVFLGVKG